MERLKELSWFGGREGPLLLIIMDGVGVAPPGEGNALFLAKTRGRNNQNRNP